MPSAQDDLPPANAPGVDQFEVREPNWPVGTGALSEAAQLVVAESSNPLGAVTDPAVAVVGETNWLVGDGAPADPVSASRASGVGEQNLDRHVTSSRSCPPDRKVA